MELQMVKPCQPKDVGSQRCRLPPQLFLQLNLSIGCFVTISIDFQEQIVCSAWPWKEQKSAHYFQCDDCVKTCHNSMDLASTPSLTSIQTGSLFQRVQVVAINEVGVTVILDNYEHVRKWSSAKCRPAFTRMVKNVLSSFVVLSNCFVSCKHETFTKTLCGISGIIVGQCGLQTGFVGRVTEETKLSISNCISANWHDIYNRRFGNFDSLGALEIPKRRLKDLIVQSAQEFLGVRSPRSLLLIGPPGTGKTTLVKAVAHQCRTAFIHIPGSSICSANPGDSERTLRDLFRRAYDASMEGPCILFVDEIDTFVSFKSQQASGEGHNNRLVSQLATLLDAHNAVKNLVIVGATNTVNLLNHSLRRPGRFDQELFIGFPTKQEREDILKTLCFQIPLSANFDFGSVAEWTTGYVGADLALLCKEVVANIITEKKVSVCDNIVPISEVDFRRIIMSFRPSMLRSEFANLDFHPVQWDDIGGLEAIKLQIKQAVEWPIKHAGVYKRLGLQKPTSILLYGPPGCCKTTLVRAAATAYNATFLCVGAAQIYSPYVGDSEKILAQVFHQGRLAAPTVLFLDEIDSLVGKRSFGTHHGVHEKVLSTLLNEMDGIGVTNMMGTELSEPHFEGDEIEIKCEEKHVVVIAATNRPDLLDEAVLRPGRFDKIIYVPPPDSEARLNILNVLMKDMPVGQLDMENIVHKTRNFTGADLVNLCREAALSSLSENVSDAATIEWRHFVDALGQVTPSLTDINLQFYEAIKTNTPY